MKRWVLVLMLLVCASPVRAELSGYFEATAANGWEGPFVVKLPEGSMVSGTAQVFLTYGANYNQLPLVTTGCVVGSGCTEWNDTTQTVLVINPRGSATLGTVGTMEWRTQGTQLMAGDPSQPVAVLGDIFGTVSGQTITGDIYDFDFNCTLSTTFVSVPGGQALYSIRFDFNDTIPPPMQQLYWDGTVWMNVGVPVPLGFDPYAPPVVIKTPPKGSKSKGRK